ncbi:MULTISPECIES: hypothetical protein [Niastella]|uniref:Uncharacterized protein n=1 Tax=Niastella soli TaxID=2821487 RepID=A0ABS3YXF0_9BACT|nr:hypothetical protein [Niastella soli]MBO9202592.1 hypothetical protein [Niastella soli]
MRKFTSQRGYPYNYPIRITQGISILPPSTVSAQVKFNNYDPGMMVFKYADLTPK